MQLYDCYFENYSNNDDSQPLLDEYRKINVLYRGIQLATYTPNAIPYHLNGLQILYGVGDKNYNCDNIQILETGYSICY